jgi:hypothetical protein
MPLVPIADPIPLVTNADAAIRISNTRVTHAGGEHWCGFLDFNSPYFDSFIFTTTNYITSI